MRGSRRHMIVLVAFIVASAATVGGQAVRPRAPTPGFYRMALGDFEIVALNDDVVPYPSAGVLPSASPQLIEESLRAAALRDPVGMSYNAFLVNTGTKLVLIDAGTGGKLDEMAGFHDAGHVLANLRAAGYRPDEIDEVYITHVGPDHIGGLTRGAERTFPKATVRIARRELEFYQDPKREAGPDSTWYRFRRALFEPYERAGKLELIDADAPLVPGIRALATPGHTPGHTSYVVESRGERLIVIGDVVHLGALQFAHPELVTVFDADRPGGAAQRQRVFELAASGNDWVAGAHLSFPGIGHVRADATGFRWVPATFAGR